VSTVYRFATKRLVADEWHILESEIHPATELPLAVSSILTPSVTASLPVAWQERYTYRRACEWIDERDQEGTNLLVIERSSVEPVGLLIIFEDESRNVRIGYMFAEMAWGNGYATELIRGFVDWCRNARIRKIIAGVASENLASQRVLHKCGFSQSIHKEDSAELFFELSLETT
jgi:RimJ/RimL family protein N-acetyltransferase